VTDGWTYGAELEWPDADTRTELPDGWGWSRTDYTVVNSDGTANDPRREIMRWGGELNTPVCGSPEELMDQAGALRVILRPVRNYRSNLHIHVRAPEFAELKAIKKIADYTWRLLPGALKMCDPLEPLLDGLEDEEEIREARLRMQHSERSRHYFVSRTRHEVRMEAATLHEMLAAEVPSRKRDGTPLWHLAPREAVNLRGLRKHGTVEFRCFAADDNAHEVWAAACFARDWLRAALNDAEVFELPYFWDLPRQASFQLKLEAGWRWTNLQHNPRDVVRQRLRDMGKLDA
jgi:hypothetical protein